MKPCLLILIGCLLCSYTAFADEVKAVTPASLRVCLEIVMAGEPSELADETRSYITREFKKIPDITLVDDKSTANAFISILPSEVDNNSGGLLGYDLSVTVLDCSMSEPITYNVMASNMSEDIKKAIFFYLRKADVGRLMGHSLMMLNNDHLEKGCHDLVAALDGGDLETVRGELKNSTDK